MPGLVMVVDDDLDVRESIRDALAMMGCRVSMAANGKEALEFLETFERPSLILLDMMMPVMNGWQFLECMKARPVFAEVPVVVLSAQSTLARVADRLGVSRCVLKPISFADLEEIALRYCRCDG